ncbi:tubulin-specific chaperone D [Athalia rosae]|uniref:tubulin-specific chaperone D n=1 Tax=Athalia rosae TaxID=37344 RepID=UPI0020342CBD|nr:tubulin-specific chaperone D [Athalia rosae]
MVISDGPDPESMGCGYNMFIEIDEVIALVKMLKNPDLTTSLIERNQDRFTFILTQYQDQPHLLDPYLDDILSSMLAIVRDESVLDSAKHNVFKYMFVIMSVKTYKKVASHLPHEVMDLVPVLRMLEKQDPNDVLTWETRYVLLVWLSIISKIPFPLSRLEISANVEPEETITNRIIKLCKLYCLSKDTCSVAAVFLIANFLNRSDIKKLYLEEIIMWCSQNLEMESAIHSALAILSSILKHCAREDLKPYALVLLDKVMTMKLNENSDSLVRKFALKVIQRIGFVLLRAKVADWRYQRASNPISLLSEQRKHTRISSVGDTKETSPQDIEDDIPPATEEIIEQLIQGLRDKVITIRWSAAKGIGRVTARLPIDLADEVVGFVLNLFSGRESDSAWHGGCLALAELGRRGLLLPHRLGDVIPLVLQALIFDEPRAYGSVGSIIRDAACYVCWSFARAFESEVLQPYVNQIAATLLIVAVFDREINCRRAASAAFQENVGRQGNFPHGIDILTVTDYFEVGVRSNAYLKISGHIAQYEEYTKSLIDHLLTRKVTHWDSAIRELSAKALCNLTPRDLRYMVETVLPNLLELLNSIDLNTRHGSVLAVAEILESLHVNSDDEIKNIIGKPAVDQISNIVRIFRSRGQFKGLGGELMKQACAVLIRKCARVRFPVHSTDVIDDWQSLLEECLNHEVAGIRLKAAETHSDFFTEYYTPAHISNDARKIIVDRYLNNLTSNNRINRMGFAQAIGYFPLFILRERAKDMIQALVKCTHISEQTLKWAESRREAFHSLTMVCQTLGVEESNTWEPYAQDLYDCYLLALGEYTIDSRGDIGAWVREAAMTGLQLLTNLVSHAKLTSILNEKVMARVIGGVAQQAVERIDRIRAQSGAVFSGLIHSDTELPNIPYHNKLRELFPLTECKDNIDWKMESMTFPRFIRMLSFPPYTVPLLRGIIYSVGGLSESLVKHSSMSFFSYLKEIDQVTAHRLCDQVLDIFEESHKNERMITSLLAFMVRLISSGCIQFILDDPESGFPRRLLILLKKEIKCINNTKLLISSIAVFCQLLQVQSDVNKQAFGQLSIFLCNKYMCVRKITAVRTYEALTLYGEDMYLPEEDLTSILNTLNTTDWEQPVAILRPIRNHLCELMKVSPPVTIKKP